MSNVSLLTFFIFCTWLFLIPKINLITDNFSTDASKKDWQNERLNFQKIALANITFADLNTVPKLPFKVKIDILKFLQHNHAATIEDLVHIKGVGQKTIAKLKTFFY